MSTNYMRLGTITPLDEECDDSYIREETVFSPDDKEVDGLDPYLDDPVGVERVDLWGLER